MNRFRTHYQKLILILLACWLSIPSAMLKGQDGKAGTQNILHEMGAGARVFGLGRAFVALADDPSAVFWNPAGLEYVPRISFSLFHTPLVVKGASYDFIGFVYPTVQLGTVGIGYSRVGVGDIRVVNEYNEHLDNGNAISDFDFGEIYISYAKKALWGLTPGITFKVQRQSFSYTNQVSSAFGFDAGVMYRPEFDSPIFNGLSFGFHFQNLIKQQLKLGANPDSLSNRLSFGLMKSIPIGFTGKLTIVADYVQAQLEGGSFHAGTEYTFKDMGTIRVGYDQNAPVFGAGIAYKFMNIDYSFGNLSTDGYFGASHRFSLTFNLGKSREEKILIAREERKQRERELVAQTREEERQRRIAEHMTRGQDFLEKGNYFDAYSEFQQVMADEPFHKTAKVLFDSTKNLIQRQLEERQQEALEKALDKELAAENQKFIELHFQQGHIHLQNKQFTDALKEFNFAMERAEDDSLVALISDAVNTTNRQLNAEVRRLVTSGRREFQRGNYSDALRILSEAFLLSPEAPELKGEIGTLTKRIKLQQYTVKGLALLELGEYQEANQVFEEALKLDPSNQAIRKYYEQTQRELGTRREKMDPESERQYLIATEHYLAGRYEKALEIWKGLAEKYPYNKKLQDAIKTTEDRIKRTKENQ
jgi:tetratricopeptide (TPR) repeat protein